MIAEKNDTDQQRLQEYTNYKDPHSRAYYID